MDSGFHTQQINHNGPNILTDTEFVNPLDLIKTTKTKQLSNNFVFNPNNNAPNPLINQVPKIISINNDNRKDINPMVDPRYSGINANSMKSHKKSNQILINSSNNSQNPFSNMGLNQSSQNSMNNQLLSQQQQMMQQNMISQMMQQQMAQQQALQQQMMSQQMKKQQQMLQQQMMSQQMAQQQVLQQQMMQQQMAQQQMLQQQMMSQQMKKQQQILQNLRSQNMQNNSQNQLNSNNLQMDDNNYILVLFKIRGVGEIDNLIAVQTELFGTVDSLIEEYRNKTGDYEPTKKFIFNARELNLNQTCVEAGLCNNSIIQVIDTRNVNGANFYYHYLFL